MNVPEFMSEVFAVTMSAAIFVGTVLLAGWIGLLAVSWIQHFRQLNAIHGRSVGRRSALMLGSTQQALTIAAERRRKLLQFLEGRETHGVVSREFMEFPQKLSDARGRDFGDDYVAAAVHTAHLPLAIAR